MNKYFVYFDKGEVYPDFNNPGFVQKYFFKRCIISDDKLSFIEDEQYQMYLPIDNNGVPVDLVHFNFNKKSIYEISPVLDGAYRENIHGVINLSHYMYPAEYTFDEFKIEYAKQIEKANNKKETTNPALIWLIKHLAENDKKKLDDRLGR